MQMAHAVQCDGEKMKCQGVGIIDAGGLKRILRGLDRVAALPRLERTLQDLVRADAPLDAGDGECRRFDAGERFIRCSHNVVRIVILWDEPRGLGHGESPEEAIEPQQG